MVNLTIDGQKVSVPQGTTIMQAAATVGIEIPRLCYLKGINEISACKVCVVEIQGQNRVVTVPLRYRKVWWFIPTPLRPAASAAPTWS